MAAPLSLALLAACGGSERKAETAETAAAPKPASITCPVLGGDAAATFDFAGAFGVDQAMAARLSRMARLAAELERSAGALDKEARDVCGALAADLGAKPGEGGHPCEAAASRLSALRQKPGAPGAAELSVAVGGVSCGVPREAVAACAGECLTGQKGVVSAVACRAEAGAGACGLDFALPDASPQCAAQCGVRALREVRCTASVEVRLGAGDGDPGQAALAEGLRRDVPRLVALGAAAGPRALVIGKDVAALVDDLGDTLDAWMAGGKSAGQRAVVGAVLAGCMGPSFAEALRASASLQASLAPAMRLHGALVSGGAGAPGATGP